MSTPTCSASIKLLPFWDPLGGDPRFEKIVVSERRKMLRHQSGETSAFTKLTKAVLKFVSPGPEKMGRFLMTWDDEGPSTSY
jgi:hypothetical protein